MLKNVVNIVKIGGNVINDDDQLDTFLEDFAKLEGMKILVHGGGKKATELASQLGLTPKMINGRRITDKENLEVVTMVYAGLINKNIVAKLQKHNCNAIGLTGADANTIKAHKRIVKEIDYGFAGDIDLVDHSNIKILLDNNLTPIFCAITHNKKGQLLNTNADTIASEVAVGLSREYRVVLTYCFEKNGVLKNIDDDNSVINRINSQDYVSLKKDKIIADGMLPKLENCFYALQHGVSKIIIGNPTLIANKDQPSTTLIL